MKRNKDRSGKVALIASMIVILLVGVCVFSLYTINEHKVKEGTETETGKLLTRETETTAPEKEDAQPATTPAAAEETGAAADADAEPAVSEGEAPAVYTEEEYAAVADTQSVVVPDASEDTAGTENAGAESGAGVDVSGTALQPSSDPVSEPAVVQDVFSDTTEVQDDALMASADYAAADYYEEPYYEETYTEVPAHQVVKDTSAEASADEGEWLFDYDTEEWYYADPAESVQQPVYTAPVVSYENTDITEDEGEWLFNEETEEWYYAEPGQEDGGASGEPETEAVEESENKESDNTDKKKENEHPGEWQFNEETQEWYYVFAEESGAAGEKPGDEEKEGEWLFDGETGEWYYVENTGTEEEKNDQETDQEEDKESDENKETGAWLYDEETGEWYYDETAVVEDDSEEEEETEESEEEKDEEKEDDETIEGEWVYDEETQEWVYMEGTADEEEETEEETTEEESTEEDTAAVEEAAEGSGLGQEIVDYAMGYVGVTPYVWAGNSLTGGTDCSGFVHLIYDKFGIYCSHASMAYDGAEFGTVVGLDELQTGDIVVYGGGAHVAIYAGDGYVVHCSSPENGTVYWKMDYRSDASWGLRVLD